MAMRTEQLDKKRTVQIIAGGVTVATSNSVTALYEDGYPARFYFPKTDIRMDMLAPSATRTQCPHKGEADYFSLVLENGEVMKDLIWRYAEPHAACAAVKNRYAFMTERCDAVYMDGELWAP